MSTIDREVSLLLFSKCQLSFTVVHSAYLIYCFWPSSQISASTGVKRKGGSGGLNKVCGVSPELQAIVGEPTMARTEVRYAGPPLYCLPLS